MRAFKLQSFCKCNIWDDWSQITIANIIIMKKSEMLRELPKCDTDMTWANAVGKTPPVNWLDGELPQMFGLLKKNKNLWSTIKCRKMRYACNKTYILSTYYVGYNTFYIIEHSVYRIVWSFPDGTVVKNLPANARDTRDLDLIPGSGRSPRVGNGNPLQYSCLENPMDRGARRATVHGSQRVRHDWVQHTEYSITWYSLYYVVYNTRIIYIFSSFTEMLTCNNFQLCSTILSSIVTPLYITYISRIYLSCNWKFVTSDHLHSFPPPLTPRGWQAPTCPLFPWVWFFSDSAFQRDHMVCDLCLTYFT